jgi:hypothetical protein
MYSKTLACYTHAVYPLDFSGRWHASGLVCFFGFWLGHMYMRSKFFAKHSPPSPIYGETKAHCTRAVYPYISPDGGMPVC